MAGLGIIRRLLTRKSRRRLSGDRMSEYPPSKLWTKAELAQQLGFSTKTIYRLICDGELEAITVGPARRAVRITHKSYLEYLERRGRARRRRKVSTPVPPSKPSH